jgi:hypothetical protein
MVYDPNNIGGLKRLPYTPAPLPEESLHGYAVRVTTQNGYLTPANLLGVRWEHPQNLARTVDELALLVSLPREVIKGMTLGFRHYVPSPHPRHQGKIEVYSRRFNLRHPHVCPKCWKEQRYVKKIFQFNLVTTCVDHGCNLENKCLCGDRITWPRLAVDKCKCGKAISEIEPTEASLDKLSLSLLYECMLKEGLTAIDEEHPLFKFGTYPRDRPIIGALSKIISGAQLTYLALTWHSLVRKDWNEDGTPNLMSRIPVEGRIPRHWVYRR